MSRRTSFSFAATKAELILHTSAYCPVLCAYFLRLCAIFASSVHVFSSSLTLNTFYGVKVGPLCLKLAKFFICFLFIMHSRSRMCFNICHVIEPVKCANIYFSGFSTREQWSFKLWRVADCVRGSSETIAKCE